MNDRPKVEFSRTVAVAALGGEARDYAIAAEKTEREALATRFDLVSLNRLEARLHVAPRADGNFVRVTGDFAADVIQTCVVTLEDAPAAVTGEIDRLFAAPHLCARDEVVEVAADEADPPDPFIDGMIDIGEVVAEHMGLELDPFPRAPGAEFESTSNQRQGTDETIEPRTNPFAILEKLKDR